MSRKRSPKQKLLGWGILAGAAVLIVVVFLITRLVSSPATPTAVAAATPAASGSSAISSSSASAETSVATATTAVSSAEPTPTSQPASSDAAANAAPSSAATVVDAAAMDQQSRKDMLLKLINQGVFTGVVADVSPPRVGVTDLFKGLSPSIQTEFVALVYAYVNNGGGGKDPLQIIDAQTGTPAGTYSADWGLKLL